MAVQQESRVKKTLLNARVNLIFYALSLFVSFFTRKIFLDKLGVDFVGLTTTLQNLLGFLNLAELGIGSAIGYVLYKPIFDKDESKLNEIISVFGYIYRWIGFVIVGAGVILSAFLPLIFKDISIDLSVVYYVYYSFLTSSLLGYFVNYKQTLLGADQKNYVVAGYLQTTVILKTILQAALAYYTQNYFIWATNEIIFGVIFSIILNWKIAKTYPWLKSDIALGKGLLKKYPEIFKYTRQLFVHKIGGVVQSQITPIFIYVFASLSTVALYGNYMMIINKLNMLISQLLGSSYASVGNLIAEGNTEKSLKIFWELVAIRFFVAGVITFSVYLLIDPFITIWLGNEFVLNESILILICINLFISMTRGATDAFKYGYGLFSDIWAPIAESIIFVTVALVGGYIWGFEGVLLGSIVSMLVIVWGWHPIFLFNKGFKYSILSYFISFVKHLLVFLFCCVGVLWFIRRFVCFIEITSGFISWILYSSIGISLFSIIYLFALYLTSTGMKSSMSRLKGRKNN
ncbi:MAG: sugar transporter [bacterium]